MRPLAIVYSGQICLQRLTKTVSILIGRLFWESFKSLVCQKIWQLLCRLRSSNIEVDGLKKKETNAFYFCVVVFSFAPIILFQRVVLPFIHHLVNQAFKMLSNKSWHVRVIVANQFVLSCIALKWQGQIPMIVVLFKWKGKSVSPQSTCFAQADLHVLKTQSIFFVISGIFKCFLSSVAHLTSF